MKKYMGGVNCRVLTCVWMKAKQVCRGKGQGSNVSPMLSKLECVYVNKKHKINLYSDRNVKRTICGFT